MLTLSTTEGQELVKKGHSNYETKIHLMARLHIKSLGKYGVLLHCYQVHSDPEW